MVGDIDKTKQIAESLNISLENYKLIDISDLSEACLKAVQLVSEGSADIVMKGLVDTSIILKAVLNKEIGLRTGNVLSHTGVFPVSYTHLDVYKRQTSPLSKNALPAKSRPC